MDRREQRISPAGFARLKEALFLAEVAGYGPDACACHALTSVGLEAKPGTETVFIVDPKLDGPIYPFTD